MGLAASNVVFLSIKSRNDPAVSVIWDSLVAWVCQNALLNRVRPATPGRCLRLYVLMNVTYKVQGTGTHLVDVWCGVTT